MLYYGRTASDWLGSLLSVATAIVLLALCAPVVGSCGPLRPGRLRDPGPLSPPDVDPKP